MRFLQATLALPHSSLVCSGARGPSPRRPCFPHPARQPGLGVRRPRPPARGIVSHPQQKSFQRPGTGGRRGEWAQPCASQRTRGRRDPAHVQPKQSAAPQAPFRPPRGGPGAPLLCPGPNSPVAGSGSEDSARASSFKPAPALGQTFQLALVPTTSEPAAPARARVARAGSGRTPTGARRGQGPSPRGEWLLPKGPQWRSR